MTEDPQMPCGRCDMGVYAYAAATTPAAIQMLDAQDSVRDALVPRCKRFDRACVGAQDFLDVLRRDPGFAIEVRSILPTLTKGTP